MKKVFLALAAVATLFATSCKKENTNAPEEPTVFNGDQFTCVIDPSANPQNAPRIEDGMSQMARIDDDNIVWWQVNDQIAYCGQQVKDGQPVGGSKDWYILNCNSTPENGGAAYFTAEGELHFDQGDHEAYYPASLHTDNGLVLPQTQVIDPDRNASHLPMYAYSAGPHYLKFQNICAVLKITVPSNLPAGCKKIVVTNNDDPFCGQFDVVDNKAIIISNDVIGENEKHVDVVKKTDETGNSFEAGEFVYVALPEGEYHNVSIQFYGKDTYGNDSLIFGSIIPDMTVRTNCIYPVTVQYRPEFCITALENETITFQKIGADAPSISLKYCTSSNYGEWEDFISTTEGEASDPKTIQLSKGEKLYLKAGESDNSNFCYYYNYSFNRHVFYASGKYAVSGKISYLLNKDGEEKTLGTETFRRMFESRNPAASNETNVIDAGNLILLSKTSTSCYHEMFSACRNLQAAPILPARTLAENCYNQMFANTAVKSVIMRATNITNANALTSWINSAKAGTIHTTSAAETWFNGNTTYKYGWTVFADQQ